MLQKTFKKMAKTAFLSVLAVSIFSQVSAFAVTTNDPISPMVPKLPKIEQPLKLNLIVASSTSTDGENWSEFSFSNNNVWKEYICGSGADFGGKSVLGISDYNDGISLQVKKAVQDKIAANPNDSNNQYYQSGLEAAETEEADCYRQNLISKSLANYTPVSDVSSIRRPRNATDYDAFFDLRPVEMPAPYDFKANFDYNPVYAYQFRYEFVFPENQKSQLSETYRDYTGLEDIYDSVVYTYTYYTSRELVEQACYGPGNTEDSYCEYGLGNYNPWKNSSQDNILNGWLIYGQNNS